MIKQSHRQLFTFYNMSGMLIPMTRRLMKDVLIRFGKNSVSRFIDEGELSIKNVLHRNASSCTVTPATSTNNGLMTWWQW